MIISNMARIVRLLSRPGRRFGRAWRRAWFESEARTTLVAFDRGQNLSLNVPVRIGGGLGQLFIGEHVSFGFEMAPRQGNGEILIQPRSREAVIHIGSGTILSNNVSIVAQNRIEIGEGCLIGDSVQIVDCDFHELSPATRRQGCGPTEPVRIGNNVWLGSQVMVLRGANIGDNSVIGAGSVVTRSIEANCLAVGAPAKVIRTL